MDRFANQTFRYVVRTNKFTIVTNMCMYKRFGARKSSIEIGVELQSYLQLNALHPSRPIRLVSLAKVVK